jgi:hypothetical protein
VARTSQRVSSTTTAAASTPTVTNGTTGGSGSASRNNSNRKQRQKESSNNLNDSNNNPTSSSNGILVGQSLSLSDQSTTSTPPLFVLHPLRSVFLINDDMRTPSCASLMTSILQPLLFSDSFGIHHDATSGPSTNGGGAVNDVNIMMNDDDKNTSDTNIDDDESISLPSMPSKRVRSSALVGSRINFDQFNRGILDTIPTWLISSS